jgi:hypothetical protein
MLCIMHGSVEGKVRFPFSRRRARDVEAGALILDLSSRSMGSKAKNVLNDDTI